MIFYNFRLLKDNIMEGDFASNVKMLQNYPPIDVSKILTTAVKLSNYV